MKGKQTRENIELLTIFLQFLNQTSLDINHGVGGALLATSGSRYLDLDDYLKLHDLMQDLIKKDYLQLTYYEEIWYRIDKKHVIELVEDYIKRLALQIEEKKGVRKIDCNSPKWEREANMIARQFCPPIYPCKDCGHPVIQGYCCDFCGSVEPR